MYPEHHQYSKLGKSATINWESYFEQTIQTNYSALQLEKRRACKLCISFNIVSSKGQSMIDI